jgi:hypothetical protein
VFNSGFAEGEATEEGKQESKQEDWECGSDSDLSDAEDGHVFPIKTGDQETGAPSKDVAETSFPGHALATRTMKVVHVHDTS